jgi:hypothetical protein
LDEVKLKSTLDSAVEALERQRNVLDSRLAHAQKRNIDKYIDRLKS